MLTLALSKGRMLDETLPLLARIGLQPAEDPARSRKLILPTNRAHIHLLVIRAADVPVYVTYGAADLGVAARTSCWSMAARVCMNPGSGISRCRLMTAGRPDAPPLRRRLRVATKYVRCAERHFAMQGRQVELIKLYGSMELAPLVGLADQIVDIVDTGNTLRANGLAPLDLIAPISARLVVNKAAMKTKHGEIGELIQALRQVVAPAQSNAVEV